MRAFAEGYYQNLIRMYKYLKINFDSQLFVYSFEKTAVKEELDKRNKECYFIYSSNNHRFTPIRPLGTSSPSWLLEVIYVAFCYHWWSFCCFWIPPIHETRSRVCESMDEYIQRIMLPRYFVNLYLLPLLSSVATCSHKALLKFPARDLTEYKRQSAGGQHYTVSNLQAVQTTLGSGLDVRFSARVMKVEVLRNERIRVLWRTSDDAVNEEIFDHVVLAVAPDIAGRIFEPLQKIAAEIPTAMVQSIVQYDSTATASGFESGTTQTAQTIHFRTSISLAQTESIHVHTSGALVTTIPLGDISSATNVLKSVNFQRALRTPRSRRLVNGIFNDGPTCPSLDENHPSWRNGEENVWLVGGWCWDGMVLLEGCMVSAVRVARALGVDIPWLESDT
jgi:hypothetical protein